MNYFSRRLEESQNSNNSFSDFLPEDLVKQIYKNGFQQKVKKNNKQFNFTGCCLKAFNEQEMKNYKGLT
jgi:hypothetical protein